MVGKDLIMATLLGSGGGSSGSGGGVFAQGSYTPAESIELSEKTANVVINHGLGVVPDCFIIGHFETHLPEANALDVLAYWNSSVTESDKEEYHCIVASSANSYWRTAGKKDVAVFFEPNEDTISLKVHQAVNGYVVLPPIEYKWYAIGGLS